MLEFVWTGTYMGYLFSCISIKFFWKNIKKWEWSQEGMKSKFLNLNPVEHIWIFKPKKCTSHLRKKKLKHSYQLYYKFQGMEVCCEELEQVWISGYFFWSLLFLFLFEKKMKLAYFKGKKFLTKSREIFFFISCSSQIYSCWNNVNQTGN